MTSLRTLSLASLLLVVATAPAWAVIEKLTKLGDIVRDADAIVTAQVEKVSERGVVLVAERDLTGMLAERRLAVSLAGAPAEEAASFTRRLAPGASVVFFHTDLGAVRAGLLYTNGSWFSLLGKVEGGKVRWQLTHSEPYLRRTYRDATESLVALIAGSKMGGGKLPEPDSTIKPGLGPEWSAAAPTAPSDTNVAAKEPPPTRESTHAPPNLSETPTGPSRWLLAGLVLVATVIALGLNLRLS